MLKAGRTEHLKYFLNNSRTFDTCWQSYKVTTRNGYDIEDISIWCDYVDMLRRLGKDIHSPKYVCPSDLYREHDRRQSELRKQREKEEIGKKRKKAMEDEERIQVLRYPFHGRYNPSPRIGECAGAFGGGNGNAPLRILQRVLPQRKLADTFGNH